MIKFIPDNYKAALLIALLSGLVGCSSSARISTVPTTTTTQSRTEPRWTLPSDLQKLETPEYKHTFGWPDGPNAPQFTIKSDEEYSFAVGTHDDRVTILFQKHRWDSDQYTQFWFDLEYPELFPTALEQYLLITHNTNGAFINLSEAFSSIWIKPFQDTFFLLHHAGFTAEELPSSPNSDISPALHSVLWALMELENRSRTHYPENVQPIRDWEWCIGNLADNGKMLVSLTHYRTGGRKGTLTLHACIVDNNMAPIGTLTCWIHNTIDKGIPPGIMTMLHGFAYHTPASTASKP